MIKTILFRSNNRIARRLVLYVVLASTFITIFTSAFQLYGMYETHINDIESHLNEIRDSRGYDIASRVWVANQQELKLTLQGILSLPDIEYIKVYEGNELIAEQGSMPKSGIIERDFPLNYRYRNEVQNIGRIHIIASLTDTYHMLIDHALAIITSNAIKTFLIAGFMLFLFHQLVTRHLSNIAEYAKNMSVGNLNRHLVLDRSENDSQHQDEFDFLVKAVHTMQFNLARSISKLSESEKYLSLALNSIGDAVIATDANDHVTRMNPAAELLTGWSFLEADGRSLNTIFNIINISARESIEYSVQNVVTADKPMSLRNHATLISKDGTEYQIVESTTTICDDDDDGHVLGMVLVFNNVTEQLQLREEATKSRRNLQAIMDNTPAVIYVKNINGRFTFINQQFEKLFHIQREEIIGKTLHDIFPKEIADEMKRNDKAVLAAGGALESEETAPQDDGVHTYATTKFPLFDEQGKIYAVCGISADITSKHNAQQALLIKEQEQREILNSMVDAVITIDELGNIVSFNKTAEELFGYSFEEIIGQNINRLMPEPHVSHHGGYVQHYLETGNAHIIGLSREVEGLHKNKQTFPLRLSIAELPADETGKRRFIGTCQDLTLIKQQDEQLRHTQKMNALGKLTGGIAHDYNNMLGVIMGYAGLLKDELNDRPDLTKFVNQIQHAGARGSKLTKKLLAFTRLKALEAIKLDINTLLQEQQDLLQKTLTVRIKLLFDLVDDVWPIWLDRSDLEDAILNISINAMHAMGNKESGAQLTISTCNKSLNILEATSLGLKTGDHVQLSFEDSGQGMDESIKEKIFDPFFSTKGDKGTGLGLSQVFGLVNRAGGSIKVISKLNHGSKFMLYFPRYSAGDTEEITETSKDDIVLGGNETILIVDDEAALRELASELLNRQGYRVFSAKNGKQALIILEQEHIDLMLSDIIMPELNGYQLASAVQEKYPAIKILLVSGYAEEHNFDTIDERLQQNLLYKPYNAQALYKNIRALLDKSANLTSNKMKKTQSLDKKTSNG